MKNVFVLDENIVISMSTLRNEKGNIDYSSGHLLFAIAENCHKVLLTESINVKYQVQYNSLTREGNIHISNAFIHLLNHMMANADKIIWDVDTEVDFPECSFDPHDYVYVSLASKRHAILVTSDDKLIKDLTNLSIVEMYNFAAKRPEEAIIDAR